ncbi:hypothetical protein [Roseovarius sp. MBR-6]|uniref:hypothetical protein n=1 Tax=Roseovarius sp. MBR-6 TaxID=3156459 RepID=UPI0033917148
MTTLTLTGIFVVFDDVNDTTSSVGTATFTVQFPNAGAVLNYTLLPGTEPDDLPLVDIGGTEPLSATVNGFDVLNNDDIETSLGFIQTPEGTHVLLAFFDPVQGVDAIFQIGGDPLTLPTTVEGFNALDDSITNVGVASGAFAPGVNIPITSLGGEITGGDVNPIEGTDGDDVLVGTAGDDLITTGNATPNGDLVVGSAGNDTIDMSGNDGLNAFVVLDYRGLNGPLDATIDGAANTGSVDKGADGTDTLLDVRQPLEAGANNGGLSILGSLSGANSFTVAPDAGQWISVRGGAGTDSYEINGEGFVRLDFAFTGATVGAQVNLATGVIADDGSGNAETITGTNNIWEVRGTDNADVLIGSDANESFISRGGNDTIDGGDGFDRLRYDRFGVSGINADLAAGTVTGVWDGNAFADTVSNIEWLRGSNGNDVIMANDSGIRMEGRNGDDTLVGGLGNDTFVGGSGANTFVFRGGFDSISDFTVGVDSLVIDIAGLTQADVDAAMQDVLFFEGQYFVTFGEAQNIGFNGLNEEQIQSIQATLDISDPGPSVINGTDGDDFLEGTAGDDLIITGNATPNGDFVVGSAGNDTIDMSGNDGVDGFVTLGYNSLGSGIAVTIDGAANTGTVDKGANGTDTLIGVEQPLFAGFGNGGLGVIGTAGDDVFNLSPGANQWMQVRGGDGADSYEINGEGFVRLDFAFTGATGGAQVNLATGVIADDGFGNAETITGTNSIWEVRGTDNDDLIIGSAADESFISRGGNDTIDGGDGFDRMRYDRAGVSGINADLAAGTVTGTWDGNAFTDTVSNIEWLRGSNSADTLAGDTNDNRLDGRGGTDTFIHVGGNDTIGDFDADNESLVLRIAGSSFLALQAAMANATDTDAGAVVDFGGGNSITFAGLTAAQVAGITVDTGGPTEGDDTLIGTAGDDFINGLGGDDLIEGGDGADDLFGGTGNDTLIGGTGPNGLFGGAGDDSLIGGIGWEDLFGGDGNDTIVGDAGNDNIGGGAGLDLIFAGDGDDTIFGGDDNDTIWGGLGDDQIGGGNGDDQINAGGGNDEVWGGAGNDQIDGGAGNDTLSGSNGNDSIDGGDGADELWGGLGNDSLSGGEGNDTIGGFDGADFLDGGAGDDELWGGAGNDTMLGGDGADQIGGDIGADSVDGGAGNDTVFAGDGNDTVLGGDGDDLIFGGAGNDRLEGGAGNDTVWGGPGADVFVFGAGDGADVFEFFNIGAGDRIELSSDLLGGAADGAAVVTAFGSIVGGNAVLDFGGGTSITLTGLTTLDGLDTVFDIV